MHPNFVVVDTNDGYLFWRNEDYQPLFDTKEKAQAFADERNRHYKPEYQTFKVFRLVPEAD